MLLQKDSYLDLGSFFLNSVKCILKPDKFLSRYKIEPTSETALVVGFTIPTFYSLDWCEENFSIFKRNFELWVKIYW